MKCASLLVTPVDPTDWVGPISPRQNDTLLDMDTLKLIASDSVQQGELRINENVVPFMQTEKFGKKKQYNMSSFYHTGTTDRTLMLCVLECLQRIAGMQKTMDGIETKLSEKFQSIIEKMCELENKIKEGRKLDVFKMAKEDFSHHKCVVESHLKELPVKSSHAVEALNVALRDEKLSVSLVTSIRYKKIIRQNLTIH